jgi:squalene synthase HpnC
MSASSFIAELERYGPQVKTTGVSLADAEAYCRRLATQHYENFTVASGLLPRRLRQHFCNVYAYCRWADDLADETDDPARSLELLDWWEAELLACFAGRATHPVFVALRRTIEEFALPPEPFRDLLVAFRRDQTQTRYATMADLREYCRYSANPVGRIVLHLGRCYSEETAALSDENCTGLQLANHWQDVARDYQRDRVYLPQEDLAAFGVHEADLELSRAGDSFRELMQYEVQQAEAYFNRGQTLVSSVSRELRLPVALFVGGGRAILQQIRRQQFDVLARRPRVSRGQKLRLLAAAWWQTRGWR